MLSRAGFFDCVRLLYLGLIAQLVHGKHGDERLGVDLAHIVHQGLVLHLVHDGDDLRVHLARVGADGVAQARAAVQLMEDVVDDLFRLGRNDAHAALDVHAEDEVIHHHAAEPRAQHAQHDRLAVVMPVG